MQRRLLLGVIGDAGVPEDDIRYVLAREVGRLAVESGFRILCGGLGGVMEAACRGAHEARTYVNGDTIGLLPGFIPSVANPWVDIALGTGLGHLRNGLVANSEAVIAIGGGAGTLSEIAFAWMYRRPIVALSVDGWSGRLAGTALDHRRKDAFPAGDQVFGAVSAVEAVALALKHAIAAERGHIEVGRRLDSDS